MGKARWVREDLWCLLNFDIPVLLDMYPQYSEGTLKGKKRYWKKQLEEGKIKMPEAPRGVPEQEQYSPEQISQIAELLRRSGVEPAGISHINKVNIWQGFIKNDEGEIETTDLYSVQYTPSGDMGEDQFIRQATPVRITPTRSQPRKNRDKTAVILPDIQAGFRKFENEALPFHDVQALDVALQIIKDTKPDQVILNGDNLDLPQFGSYEQESSYAQTLNMTLDYVHQLLGQIRSNSPDSQIVYLAGNHEQRLTKYINRYAKELWGIRQAGTASSILTVPFLLNLAALDVRYESGYPANKYYINDRLKVIHGNVVRAAGQTAAAIVRKEEDSTIFGHTHHHEYGARTSQTRYGARLIIAQSFGCLARIDGHVPSYHNGVDDDGRPVTNFENWQQGLGIVEYRDGDAPFNTHQITIQTHDGYETRFNGKIYTPNSGIIEPRGQTK